MNLSWAVQSFLESVGVVSKDFASNFMFLVRFCVSQKIPECRERGWAVQRDRRRTVYPSLVFWKITTDRQRIQTREFCLLFKKTGQTNRHCRLVTLFPHFLVKWGHVSDCHSAWTPIVLQPHAFSFLKVFPLIQNLLKSVKIHAAQ